MRVAPHAAGSDSTSEWWLQCVSSCSRLPRVVFWGSLLVVGLQYAVPCIYLVAVPDLLFSFFICYGNFHSTHMWGKNINALPCTDQNGLADLGFSNSSQLAGAPLPGQLQEKLIKFNGCYGCCFWFETIFYLKLQEEAINCSIYHGFKKKWKSHRKMWSTLICKTNIHLYFALIGGKYLLSG